MARKPLGTVAVEYGVGNIDQEFLLKKQKIQQQIQNFVMKIIIKYLKKDKVVQELLILQVVKNDINISGRFPANLSTMGSEEVVNFPYEKWEK